MLRSPLLGTLRELERLHRDAEQALVARPSQGQQTAKAGASAAARAALFDDDLDLRAPDSGLSGRWLPMSLRAFSSYFYPSSTHKFRTLRDGNM